MSSRLHARIKGYVDKRTGIPAADLRHIFADAQAGLTGDHIDQALAELQADHKIRVTPNGNVTSLGTVNQ